MPNRMPPPGDHPPEELLCIGCDAGDGASIVEALAGDGASRVECVATVFEALDRLQQPGVTAILLNVSGSGGITAFDIVAAAAGQIPILALCAVDDEGSGRLAVE